MNPMIALLSALASLLYASLARVANFPLSQFSSYAATHSRNAPTNSRGVWTFQEVNALTHAEVPHQAHHPPASLPIFGNRAPAASSQPDRHAVRWEMGDFVARTLTGPVRPCMIGCRAGRLA